MTKKEQLLEIINMMCKEEYTIPDRIGTTLKDYIFHAYQSWAIRELRNFVMSSQQKDPIMLIDEFRILSDNMACFSKTSNNNFKYSVMEDVATYVLDEYLISSEGESE